MVFWMKSRAHFTERVVFVTDLMAHWLMTGAFLRKRIVFVTGMMLLWLTSGAIPKKRITFVTSLMWRRLLLRESAGSSKQVGSGHRPPRGFALVGPLGFHLGAVPLGLFHLVLSLLVRRGICFSPHAATAVLREGFEVADHGNAESLCNVAEVGYRRINVGQLLAQLVADLGLLGELLGSDRQSMHMLPEPAPGGAQQRSMKAHQEARSVRSGHGSTE
mmetsp:Transcript_37129/g.112093  ORF Transcript_37129/g.112093 Transcript_37129/m.112093 type:complete len:218 (+) Transcript_37129:433-1086(+)